MIVSCLFAALAIGSLALHIVFQALAKTSKYSETEYKVASWLVFAMCILFIVLIPVAAW